MMMISFYGKREGGLLLSEVCLVWCFTHARPGWGYRVVVCTTSIPLLQTRHLRPIYFLLLIYNVVSYVRWSNQYICNGTKAPRRQLVQAHVCYIQAKPLPFASSIARSLNETAISTMPFSNDSDRIAPRNCENGFIEYLTY